MKAVLIVVKPLRCRNPLPEICKMRHHQNLSRNEKNTIREGIHTTQPPITPLRPCNPNLISEARLMIRERDITVMRKSICGHRPLSNRNRTNNRTDLIIMVLIHINRKTICLLIDTKKLIWINTYPTILMTSETSVIHETTLTTHPHKNVHRHQRNPNRRRRPLLLQNRSRFTNKNHNTTTRIMIRTAI